MAENKTQEKISQETSDEKKNTETTQEATIPKSSFDAVSEKYKKAKAEKEALESKFAEIDKATLKEKEDYKGLVEKLETENKGLKVLGIKQDLIQQAINNKEIDPFFSKFIKGETEEEISQSIEEAKTFNLKLQEKYKSGKTASDDSGTGKVQSKEPMSQEEWMELYQKNPEEADKIFDKERAQLTN